MENNGILDTLNTLIMTPLAISYIFILTGEWRIPAKTVKRILLIFLIFQTMLDLAILSKWGGDISGKRVVAVVNVFDSLILTTILLKYRNGRALFIYFSAANFVQIGAALGEIVGNASGFQRLLVKVPIYFLIFIMIYCYFRPPFLKILEQITSGWHTMTCIAFFLFLLSMALHFQGRMYYDMGFQIIGLILCLTVVSIYVAFYQVFVSVKEQCQKKAGFDLLLSQMNSIQKRVNSLQAANKRFSIFRHDMRHFFQIQSVCLEKGDFEGAKKILDSMDENLNEIGRKVQRYTGNVLIDAVLSDYAVKAEESHIDFDIQVYLPEPGACSLLEFAVVLANGLENAYFACLNIPSEEKRRIRILGARDQKQYFLEIANTYAGEVHFKDGEGRPVSGRPGHGFGTQSIMAFAEKNQAFVDFKAEEEWFRMRIIFRQERREGDENSQGISGGDLPCS